MKNVSIPFDILEGDEQPFPIHNYMPCHMVFYVNMEFNWKSRYVSTVFHAPKYDESRYTGVVSHKSVQISFTYASINGIYIMLAAIQNFYLTAPFSEKYWNMRGPEFGS